MRQSLLRGFALATLAVSLPACPRHHAAPASLVWTLTHPVETPWSPAGPTWEVRFAARVDSDGGRDRPPEHTFPCISMEVRVAATGAPAGGGGVACDRAVTPSSPADMTRAAEALLGTPAPAWTGSGHFMEAHTPRWAHALIVLPPGSTPGFRQGDVAAKGADPWNDGLKCDAWDGRSDCVIQEYEAILRARTDVRQVVGFLTDVPARSAVLLVVAPGASPAALSADVLAHHPGPNLPIRVRPWASLPAAPTSEELWALMDAEGKLPP